MTDNYPDGVILDAEEQGYEDAHEQFVPGPESMRQTLSEAATAGRRPLSVRLDSSDLAALKRRAEREGVPYQTLLGSIVHKYVTGTLVDIDEARKIIAR